MKRCNGKEELIISCNNRNLNATGWHLITGKAASTVRQHWHKKQEGYSLTLRQVVGYDVIDWDKVKRKRAIEKAPTPSEIASKLFFSKRLVGV